MLPVGIDIPKQRYVGYVGCKYIYEIAKLKKSLDPDLHDHNIIGLCKMIIAQANNMGISIVKDQVPPLPTIPKKI